MKTLLICIFVLSILPTILAVQESTQQSNKIFLNPFYRASMTNGLNYTYNVSINPPDKISSVLSSIVSFDVYITPTVTFNIWVNNKACSTPSFTISTTFAGSGQSRITFDCSNVINKAGNYNITLRPTSANTGAVSGWIDLTYMNNPTGELKLHGTEYQIGNPAKIWLQLLNTNQSPITNAICYTDIYTPSGGTLIERALMTNMQHDGIYYYDLIAPSTIGVYPAIALCYYTAGQVYNNVTNYSIGQGSYDSGTISEMAVIDGNFIRFKETTVNPIRNISVNFTFNNGQICNTSEELLTGISIITTSRFDSVANDDITMYLWNYSSSSWITLPNKLLEGPGFASYSNSLVFNNITKVGLVNGSGTKVIVRFTDTNLTDGATSNLDIDYLQLSCDQLTNPLAQEVRGSSEMHISDFTNLTLNINNSVIISDIWSYSNRSLTEFNFDVVNETEIANAVWNFNGTILSNILTQIANSIWSSPSRNLTFYPTQVDLTNYSLIQTMVWNATNRSLTEFNFDIVNESLISDTVWSAINRSLTEFNFTVNVNETAISNAVWNNVNRTLTDFNFVVNTTTNLSEVADIVWNAVNRTLTDYNQTDLTDYERIINGVWNATNRNLTFYEDTTNYSLIQELVWNATARTLTDFNFTVDVNLTAISDAVWNSVNRTLSDFNFTVEINNTLVAENVWSYFNRTLTDYNQTAQVDLTNYTLIEQLVWNATNRSLTEFNFDVVNESEIAQTVWDYFNRTLTDFNFTVEAVVNVTEIANAVWENVNRTLTDYNQTAQVDLTNYSLIQELVWNATQRTLTEFNFTVDINNTELTNEIWNYYNRSLTYYDLGNNLDANDVWTYSNRTLTDYGNDITASDVWTYNNRTLTSFNFDLMNVTISINNSEQIVNAITCQINNLLKANNGEWIIDIEGC